jgi:hypothetical protein
LSCTEEISPPHDGKREPLPSPKTTNPSPKGPSLPSRVAHTRSRDTTHTDVTPLIQAFQRPHSCHLQRRSRGCTRARRESMACLPKPSPSLPNCIDNNAAWSSACYLTPTTFPSATRIPTPTWAHQHRLSNSQRLTEADPHPHGLTHTHCPTHRGSQRLTHTNKGSPTLTSQPTEAHRG